MSVRSQGRERDRWSRSLVLVTLLAVGTACGGGGATRSADDRPDAATEHPAGEGGATDAGQTATPSPFGQAPGLDVLANAGGPPVPPPPGLDLATRRPEVPPNTVSLDALHQQGRAHVLR